MCGFAGIFHLSTPKPVDPARVERMCDAIAHRGPDGFGVWTAPGVGLGHRRLSILDLSPLGHQPMQSACGRYVTSFNGEIYNFQALRGELEAGIGVLASFVKAGLVASNGEARRQIKGGGLKVNDETVTDENRMICDPYPRLLVARGLIHEPQLVLLDEPTEGLAPVIVQQIGRTIAALKQKGFTILLVEQNFRFASTVADRYYVMEHGRIIDQFANAELDANVEKLHDYLGV